MRLDFFMKQLKQTNIQLLHDALQFNIQERIDMVEALWDSIAENSELLTLSDAQRKLLDERLDNHLQNPQQGDSWEVVKARIVKQL